MDEIAITTVMGLLGLAGGCVLGAMARHMAFCTFGAIEDVLLGQDFKRLRSWALAIATAIILVQLMRVYDIARIQESFYLTGDFGWPGAVLGGLMFGYGMSMVGTCGYGAIVRAAGGDMRALIAVIIIGCSAYMTARGLTGVLRITLVEPFNGDLTFYGGQGLPHVIGGLTGIPAHKLFPWVAGILSAGLALWVFSSREFRADRALVVGGLVVGATIAFGFFATGYIGNDDFDPQQVRSFTFTRPPGDTLVYLMTWSGAHMTFAIGTVFGTFLGAFVVALAKGQLRMDAFDDAIEMRRHLFGAALMGIGGVLAVGCTVGQGMSAMAVMATSAPIMLASTFVGSWLGLNVLVEGSFTEGLRQALAGLGGSKDQ